MADRPTTRRYNAASTLVRPAGDLQLALALRGAVVRLPAPAWQVLRFTARAGPPVKLSQAQMRALTTSQASSCRPPSPPCWLASD